MRHPLSSGGWKSAAAYKPPMLWFTQLKTRFGETDHAGRIYYPNFFHYFHCALEDFLEHGGFDYRKAIEAGLGWPAVKAVCEYQKPLFFGEQIDVTLETLAIGRSSVQLRHRVKRSAQSWADTVASGEVTIVACDLGTGRSIAIPGTYRSHFESATAPKS